MKSSNENFITSQSVISAKKERDSILIEVLNQMTVGKDQTKTVKIDAKTLKAFKACENQFDACKVILPIYNENFPHIVSTVKAPRRILQNVIARLLQDENLTHNFRRLINGKKQVIKTTKKVKAKKDAKKRDAKKTVKTTKAKKEALEVKQVKETVQAIQQS